MGVLDASRSRPVMCWKRFCGFSTQVRNGTCCRKAIRTTKLCVDAFKAIASMIGSLATTVHCQIRSPVECAPDGGQFAGWELTGAAGLSEDESHGQAPHP